MLSENEDKLHQFRENKRLEDELRIAEKAPPKIATIPDLMKELKDMKKRQAEIEAII